MFRDKSARGMVAMLALTVSLTGAEAGFRGRQGAQAARINQGVASGQLTNGEAARLRAGERHEARQFRRFNADGNISPAEAAKLRREQARDISQIFRQKHDGQTAGGQGGQGGQGGDGRPMDLGSRDTRQDGRIAQGVQSGQLTPQEAAWLKMRDARIAELNAKLAKNGLTPQERLRLQHQRDVLSKQIYHQKHDNQTAAKPGAPGTTAPGAPAPVPAPATGDGAPAVTAPASTGQ